MGFITTGWLRLASGTDESNGEMGRCERRETGLISTKPSQCLALQRKECKGLTGEARRETYCRLCGPGCQRVVDYARCSTLNCTHISLPSPDFITHARRPQGLKICEGPVFYCPLLGPVSHHGHFVDSVTPYEARPGLRGPSGRPLPAFNTRTGDSFRRPI
jgi:hypothetical protein